MKGRLFDESSRDAGSVMLLGVMLVAVCVLALVIAVDVSAVFLQRRNLAAIADASALAGAQAIDLDAYYSRGASTGTTLDPIIVARVVRANVAAIAGADGITSLRLEEVESDGETVLVRLSAPISVPFLGSLIGEHTEVMANARLDYRPTR